MTKLKAIIYRLGIKWINKVIKQIYFTSKIEKPSLILADSKYGTFFGYHDKSPFSQDNSKVLAHRVPVRKNLSEMTGLEAELGYYNLASPSQFHHLDKTAAWSWQLGSMLQFDRGASSDRIIYNIIDSQGKVVSKEMELVGNKESLNNYSVYCISNNGQWAATLNFFRLGALRPGYGIGNLDKDSLVNHPSDDGVFFIDRKNQKQNLLASLHFLFNRFGSGDSDSISYVNHLSFSPDSKYLSFYYIERKSSNRRITFLIYNLAKESFERVPVDGVISHYSWSPASDFLMVSCANQKGLWNYFKYDLKGKSLIKQESRLFSDTHPMIHPMDYSKVISDTYRLPDNKQYLFEFRAKKEVNRILYFEKMPPQFKGEVRCDFHPRYSLDGTMIAIDTVKEGNRCLAIFNSY